MDYLSIGFVDDYEIRLSHLVDDDEDAILIKVLMIGFDRTIQFTISLGVFDVDSVDAEELTVAEFVEEYKDAIVLSLEYYLEGNNGIVADIYLCEGTLEPSETQRFWIQDHDAYFGLDIDPINGYSELYIEYYESRYIFYNANELLSVEYDNPDKLLDIYYTLSGLQDIPHEYINGCLIIDAGSANAIYEGMMLYMSRCYRRTGMTFFQFTTIMESLREMNFLSNRMHKTLETVCTHTLINPLLRNHIDDEPEGYEYIAELHQLMDIN